MTVSFVSDPVLDRFTGHVVLVGAGQMGGALLAGWLRIGLDPARITVIDPRPADNIRKVIDAHGVALDPPHPQLADLLVLAVKPQMAATVMPLVARLVARTTVILSVMAGKTIASMEAVFGREAAIVRTIPNTPASVGRGVTGAVANGHVTRSQKAMVDALLGAVSHVEWLDREDLIDAVTALSGSGPAYVFHLVEAMAKAGAAAGLPPDAAMRFARLTVEGAGELLHRAPGLTPATLRQNVTSPNGTTQAALDVLMGESGLEPLMTRAIAAAAKRSRELAG